MSTLSIFGAGPTGLTLAWIYAKQGRKVVVYDKYKNVGGSWATKWTEDGLFTQHSPQILTSAYVNTFDLFDEMKIDKSRFLQPYKSSWTNMDLGAGDVFVLGLAYMDYMVRNLDHITVNEYLGNSLSDRGQRAIESVCYLLDGIPPSTMTMGELLGTFDQTAFYSTLEMSKATDDPIDGMGTLWKRALDELGVEFKFNTELVAIEYDGFNLVANVVGGRITIHRPDELVLSIDPRGIVGVLDKSPDVNWSWGKNARTHLTKGMYHSLSIQFHFDEDDLYVTPETANGTSTAFGIICVKVPSSVTRSGSTLSSTILNLEHVTGMDAESVKRESWRQIRLANPHLPEMPRSITIGEGTEYDTGKWKFDLSAAARTTLGPFPSRGIIHHISIVGPVNDRRFKATTMEAAVEAAKLFAGQPIRHSYTLSKTIWLVLLLLVVLVLWRISDKV